MNRKQYLQRIFSLKNREDFENLSLKVFRFQARHNKVYSSYLSALGVQPEKINSISAIPYLPIELFKSHNVVTALGDYSRIFTSSGTTGEITSRHFIKDDSFYSEVCLENFHLFYGNPENFAILALLPSYLEREGSSLVFMMEKLIETSRNSRSGFYLHDHEKLNETLLKAYDNDERILLFGVTYALLDFASEYPNKMPRLTVMETGGMKGKRKEMIREEVHDILCNGFGVEKIHSEYGMTELLSQAYSKGDGVFETPPWMSISIRDSYDPLQLAREGESGGINIIDLANIDSCSFIATQDLGKKYADGKFEILGRFDLSDVRGCNLMIE